MKQPIFTTLFLSLFTLTSAPAAETPSLLADPKAKVSYALGMNIGDGVDFAQIATTAEQQKIVADLQAELAQRTADEYVSEARRQADSLVSEAQEQARAAVAALEGQRADLEGRVTALRTFEAEIRTRLTGYFESQLRDLRAIAEPPAQ